MGTYCCIRNVSVVDPTPIHVTWHISTNTQLVKDDFFLTFYIMPIHYYVHELLQRIAKKKLNVKHSTYEYASFFLVDLTTILFHQSYSSTLRALKWLFVIIIKAKYISLQCFCNLVSFHRYLAWRYSYFLFRLLCVPVKLTRFIYIN